jgi:hypothetical protein
METLNLFAALDAPLPGQRRALTDPSRLKDAIDKVATGLGDSLKSESRLHGWRADRLFGLVAADLDGCILVKQEDAGDTYYEGDDLKVPDWSLVLKSGLRLLVEVKSLPPTEFRFAAIKKQEVQRLRRYANIVGRDLYIATFWSALGMWTLVPADDFIDTGDRLELTIERAMIRNHMGIHLEDNMLGVRPPLEVRLRLDGEVVESNDETRTVAATITSVRLLCGGKEMVTDEEKQLVWFLLNYSSWPAHHETITLDDGGYEAVLTMEPEEWEPAQGFAIVGRLSDLYSRYFRLITSDEAGIHTLTVDTEPGMMPRLIPASFRSERLPLWHFRIRPPIDDEN